MKLATRPRRASVWDLKYFFNICALVHDIYSIKLFYSKMNCGTKQIDEWPMCCAKTVVASILLIVQ